MSETTTAGLPPPSRDLSGVAAIVGIGESDYRRDYQAARARAPGYAPPIVETLATTAFERALADSGLRRADIDGLSTAFIYGGPAPAAMAGMLGLAPRRLAATGGIMAGPLPIACAAIAAGECDAVVLIYASVSRAIGRQYGGATYGAAAGTPSSYYYHHPWGWSSQAAHWAFIARHYLATYGLADEALGAVAVQLRRNARDNPDAIMRTPMTIADYAASRAIVRPLRLFDLCLVNDGAVCLIVTRSDRARDLPHAPVLVAGWGEAKAKGDKMHNMVRERLRPQLRAAGAQALAMAGLDLADIGHLEAYDPASIHLVNQIEGYGFTAPGTALHDFAAGGMAAGGWLPVNTAGGMISGSYMHGWNLVAENVRQLRHEAGARQVAGLRAGMFSLAQTDQAHPIIFTRGD